MADSKKKKWLLAYLTGKVPAELQGQQPDEPTSGEIVAFINALDPQVARRHSADYNLGPRFKQKVEEAFEKYRIETQTPEPQVKLPKLKGKNGPLTYVEVMNMSGNEHNALVFDEDGRAKVGVREALAKIIDDERQRQRKAS